MSAYLICIIVDRDVNLSDILYLLGLASKSTKEPAFLITALIYAFCIVISPWVAQVLGCMPPELNN